MDATRFFRSVDTFFHASFGDILTSVDFKQMDRLCSQISVKVLWDWPMTTLTDESHEMWKIDELGVACWVFGENICSFDLRGGDSNLCFRPRPSSGVTASDQADPLGLSITSIEGQSLPSAAEQFICENRLSVNYPQGDQSYAIRLSIEPIANAAGYLVFEVTVSIQTDLLDSHPMVDLIASGDRVISYSVDSEVDNWRANLGRKEAGVDPLNLLEVGDGSVAILLGQHDAPTTKNMSNSDSLQLRLFGDFLEKGVIRTARPWVIFSLEGKAISREALDSLYQELEKRPLPLAT